MNIVLKKNPNIHKQEITDDEFSMIIKLRVILARGNSAEVKRKTDGGLTVYEVRKEKR